jgi:hypothetical protein
VETSLKLPELLQHNMPQPAPTGLNVSAYYSVGDWDGYLNLDADFNSMPRVSVYYRISTHAVGAAPGVYVWLMDFPWEYWWAGINIKYAHADPGTSPAGRHTLYDQLKVETRDLDTDTDANAGVTIFSIPQSLSLVHNTATNFTSGTSGDIGNTLGSCNIFWTDLTRFVASGKITLSKYGVTSPQVKQILGFRNFNSKPGNQPNHAYFQFLLLPPGIGLYGNPPVWDPDDPSLPDINPLWVVEGDTLTFTLETNTNDPADSTPTRVSTYNFKYYHTARFYQFADAATKGQPYSSKLEIIQDPWVPDVAIGGTFAAQGGFPPTFTLDPDGTLHSAGPTTSGTYLPKASLVSKGGITIVEPFNFIVNITGLPVILAPPHTMSLTWGLPYKPAYQLYATYHPTSWSYTGTLPTGLSLDTATGVISGTPNVEQVQAVTFSATNAAGVSAPYTVTMTVAYYMPPSIISDSTVTFNQGDASTYEIETDRVAQAYRGSDFPTGMRLIGKVLTGTPSDLPGSYIVGLQAANRWGWSSIFQLTVTIRIAPPKITSPLSISQEVGSNVNYQITGTHAPFGFAANDLPRNLMVNQSTGMITGFLVAAGSSTATIQAFNQGGMGSAVLIIDVTVPPIPVIDTAATHGRAITADTTTFFKWQPAASHYPFAWAVDQIPGGMSLDVNSGLLSGIFDSGGLYAVSFTCTNAGGVSDPAVFYFLVTIGEGEAAIINELGTVMEIWVDLDTAVVGIGNKLTIQNDQPIAPTGTDLALKRGDTTEIHIIFHQNGIPTDVNLTSMKFGVKAAYDDEFIVYTEQFTQITLDESRGRFSINPDFSGTNDDLDAILVNPLTTLLGEIQWEMEGGDPVTPISIRRSTKVFNVVIARDLIHPD